MRRRLELRQISPNVSREKVLAGKEKLVTTEDMEWQVERNHLCHLRSHKKQGNMTNVRNTNIEIKRERVKNPCAKCWAKGFCDEDDCGRQLFPLFVNGPDYIPE